MATHKISSWTVVSSILLAAGLTVGGCTQLPTEKQGVSDIRPQISFRPANEKLHMARVVVDGLDMGAVGDFIDGTSSLRLLSGTHILRIIVDGRPILEEKFYSGEGVNRSFTVN